MAAGKAAGARLQPDVSWAGWTRTTEVGAQREAEALDFARWRRREPIRTGRAVARRSGIDGRPSEGRVGIEWGIEFDTEHLAPSVVERLRLRPGDTVSLAVRYSRKNHFDIATGGQPLLSLVRHHDADLDDLDMTHAGELQRLNSEHPAVAGIVRSAHPSRAQPGRRTAAAERPAEKEFLHEVLPAIKQAAKAEFERMFRIGPHRLRPVRRLQVETSPGTRPRSDVLDAFQRAWEDGGQGCAGPHVTAGRSIHGNIAASIERVQTAVARKIPAGGEAQGVRALGFRVPVQEQRSRGPLTPFFDALRRRYCGDAASAAFSYLAGDEALLGRASTWLSTEGRSPVPYRLSAQTVDGPSAEELDHLLKAYLPRPDGLQPGCPAPASAQLAELARALESASKLRRVWLTDLRTGADLDFNDVGVGVSELLPVLAAAFTPTSSTIALEQPELHLHPALQCEVSDLIIESALDREHLKTWIVETHSEHLILRILRRIRETSAGKLPKGRPPITPDDVSVVYVAPARDGSSILPMRVDEDGFFADPWPGGFFEEGFRERFGG